MNIQSASIISPKLVHYPSSWDYAFAPLEDIRKTALGLLFNSILAYNTENTILHSLKNIRVTKADFQKRIEHDGQPENYDGNSEDYRTTGN